MRTAPLATLLFLALAGSAAAQPGVYVEADAEADIEVPPPAPPAPVLVAVAPQTHAWRDVSNINGTVVPVGEQNRYLYELKRTLIATNPLGWMFGFYGASLSRAMSEHVALRFDANLFHFESTKGYEIGATLPLYLRRTFSGPFLEAGVLVRSFRDTNDSDYYDEATSADDVDTTIGPQVMFGWHWMFDSGLNVAVAFGAVKDVTDDHSDEPEPAGYFRIGYAF